MLKLQSVKSVKKYVIPEKTAVFLGYLEDPGSVHKM